MKSFLILLITMLSLSCSNSLKREDSSKFINSIYDQRIETAEIDTFILDAMDSLKIPAISVAIINDANIVYHRTFGIESVNSNNPIDGQSLFDGASLTKTVFTYLVMRMADKEVIDLDTPLYKYSEFPDIEHDERYKLITARMVLCHSSGLPNWRWFNEDNKLDIKFTPGTDFNYSGEGYEYLASVLAHLNNLEKDSLECLMQKHVYDFLGMENTHTTWNNDVADKRIDGHIDGMVKKGWGISRENPGFYAAYSIQTEAIDYAKFMIALINGKGLSGEGISEMLKIQIRSKDDNRIWGLGTEIIEYSNNQLLYKHGGFNNDFASGYIFSRDSKNGYVYFTNSDSGNDLFSVLYNYMVK